jgi:phenylacetate-CoA ligase
MDNLDIALFQNLPYTTKDDLRSARKDIASAKTEDAWIYYETTGTTGASTPCPRNEIDSIHNNTPLILRYGNVLKQFGDKNIVGVMGPTEVHSTGDTFEDVIRSLNLTTVKMWPRSPVIGNKRAVELIQELNIKILVCTPAVAISLARFMLRDNRDPKLLGIKAILTVGELTTPYLLNNIGALWNASVYNCMYASQEASIMAAVKPDKSLYSIPLNNYYEFIDPDTDNLINLSIGDTYRAELIVTNLYLGQKPLIRYRTGDMMEVTKLPDGSLKLIPLGRVKDRLIINNKILFAYDLESMLLKYLDGCIDYQIKISQTEGKDSISALVEFPIYSQQNSHLIHKAVTYLEQKLNIKIVITEGATDSITGSSAMVSWKAARITDNRDINLRKEVQMARKVFKEGDYHD